MKYPNTLNFIVRSLSFNKDVNELEFEILDDNCKEGTDSKKNVI